MANAPECLKRGCWYHRQGWPACDQGCVAHGSALPKAPSAGTACWRCEACGNVHWALADVAEEDCAYCGRPMERMGSVPAVTFDFSADSTGFEFARSSAIAMCEMVADLGSHMHDFSNGTEAMIAATAAGINSLATAESSMCSLAEQLNTETPSMSEDEVLEVTNASK